jgi:single-stranded DNA-binding protein
MSFSVEGKLYKKFDTQQIKDTFKKREFVLEYTDNPMYPQYVNFQLVQDKVDMIEPFQEGQTLKVEFNLRGREWRSPQGDMKYFNSLDAWRIQPVQQEQPQGSGGNTPPPPPPPPADAIDVSQADDDDLPF